ESKRWIEELGKLTRSAKELLSSGQTNILGQIMNQAHSLLQKLTVSDDILDQMVIVAREQGALGAKLTGGGRGGCMIALAENQSQ
ncbi:mevalonate kinase family protein, partial [Streptococcus pyogenes]